MARTLPKRKPRLECGHVLASKLIMIHELLPIRSVWCDKHQIWTKIAEAGEPLWQ